MIEVLKQMQEALREYHYYTIDAGLPNQSMLNKGYAAFQAGKQAIKKLESQEPVAWRWETHNGYAYSEQHYEGENGQPLYTHPPQRTEPKVCCQQYDTCLEPCTPRGTHLAQRTWVGLTDDEIYKMYSEPTSDSEMIAFAREVESKLKEKNT